METIVDLAKQRSGTQMKLVIDGPLTILDHRWNAFAEVNQDVVEKATRAISDLTVRTRLRWKNRATIPGTRNTDLTVVPRWEALISQMTGLRSLTLTGGHGEEFFPFITRLIQRCTFPRLEILHITSAMTRYYHDEQVLNRPPRSSRAYTTQALSRFLLRHRETLHTVTLGSASGETSVSSLQGLLELMRTSLIHLENVEILEWHYVGYTDDAEPLWGVGTPYGHLLPPERDRAREEHSQIGRLARACGVQPTELPVLREEGGDEEHVYGRSNRVYQYVYDFGPYVLRKASPC